MVVVVKINIIRVLTYNKLAKSTALITLLISSVILPHQVIAEERQGLLLNAELTAEYDDNVLRKANATSDNAIKLAPELQYLTNFGKHVYAVNYQGEYTLYNDNTKLNYDNHNIALLAKLDHSHKLSSEFKLAYKDEIEEPGSNNSSSLLITQFNQTEKKQAIAKFYYGKRNSIGQLVLGLDHNQNRYTNNLQGYRDYDRNRISGTFFFRIAPKTRLLFQATLADYEYFYQKNIPSRSSKESFYLAGVEWELTAKTSGSFKIGYQGKDFKQNAYSDISGLSYMLDMTWKPNTYSKIKIAATRMSQESSQLLGSAFITNTYSIIGEHKITPRTKLTAGYTFDTADITYVLNRTDKRNDISLGINHSLRTWLEIKLDYQFMARKSDYTIYEFTSNVVGLSLTTTFD